MGFFDDIVGVAREFNTIKQEATSAVGGVVNDFVNLKDEVVQTAADLKDEAIQTASDLKGEATSVRSELVQGIKNVKKDTSDQ